MKRKGFKKTPNIGELEVELRRVKHKKKYFSVLKSTIYTLITVAAIAVLIATLWLPVLQIYGNSMTPTLTDGEIVFSIKTENFETGDIIAFYHHNKILVKRVICDSGDWVDIDENGNVFVNSQLLNEPYISEKSLGDCNIELPYQVPEGKIFVMGDHRDTSVDSRNTAVGCISDEDIVGKIIFRVWPLVKFGIL
ncbi:MAG: signal peptidase I [Clostridia bacterium]|nr:signal peptidase I [Clostridia bacterium]